MTAYTYRPLIASIFAGALSLTVAPAQADKLSSMHTQFTGPYIGGQVGGSLARGTFDFSPGGSQSDATGAPDVRLFFGYGYEYQTAYVGLELSTGYSRPHLRSGEAEISASVDPAADLRVGFTPFRQVLLWAKAGVSARDLRLRATTEDEGFTPGLRLGFGSDYNVTPRVFLRADFTSTFYKSLEANTSTGSVDGSLSTHQVGIGVGYRF